MIYSIISVFLVQIEPLSGGAQIDTNFDIDYELRAEFDIDTIDIDADLDAGVEIDSYVDLNIDTDIDVNIDSDLEVEPYFINNTTTPAPIMLMFSAFIYNQ